MLSTFHYQPKMFCMLFFVLRVDENVIKITTTNLSKYSMKIEFIKHENVVGALVNPKDMTVNS